MKSITITKEQFSEAIDKAQKMFEETGEKHPEVKQDPMQMFLMKLQNIVFGGLIGSVLFGEEEDE